MLFKKIVNFAEVGFSMHAYSKNRHTSQTIESLESIDRLTRVNEFRKSKNYLSHDIHFLMAQKYEIRLEICQKRKVS